MAQSRLTPRYRFTRPVQQIILMCLVVGFVSSGIWFLWPKLSSIFAANPLLNGFIAMVFCLGVITCFWQVFQIIQSVKWIKPFTEGRVSDQGKAPRLLSPLAALLGSRDNGAAITTTASRSILDSVDTRMDESRDITRYLANLLIFLGLLGTFYGLATTVPAIVETIRTLSPKDGENNLAVFERLMHGLESQLGGMGTAFSSSLLGLAGSLVIGLLELFAGHGQNRFFRELEDWLSSITDIESAPNAAGDNRLYDLLDMLARKIDGLQQSFQTNSDSMNLSHDWLEELLFAVTKLNQNSEAQQLLLAQLMETKLPPDAESRMRLRSIDSQLSQVIETIGENRQESLGEIRHLFKKLGQSLQQTRG